MPNPKSDARKKAEQMYKDSKGSVKLVEIAEQLGIPASKVRKWKSVDGWDRKDTPSRGTKKKRVERSTSGKGNAPQDNAPPVKRKRGAPYGNKNCAGKKNALGNNGGAPLRNKNSEKHGIYADPFADLLDGRDKEVYDCIQGDEEENLVETIKLLTVRERWLIQKIQQLQNQQASSHGMMINSVNRMEHRREFDGSEEQREEDKRLYEERQRAKVESGDKLPGRDISISTTSVENSDLLLRAHAELTRVQSQKTRCIETLNKIRQSKGDTRNNTVANDWITALLTGGDAHG